MPIDEAGFLKKVLQTDACWLWTFRRDKDGYGTLTVDRVKRRAHRVAYELLVGEIPAGVHVLHRCDVPACVRPDHLFLGTNGDNVRDRVSKRRGPRGARNIHAVLTAADVIAIRRRYSEGARMGALAVEYGVWKSTVADIVARRTWPDVAA